MFRRDFLKVTTTLAGGSLVLGTGPLSHPSHGRAGETDGGEPRAPIAPRGTRRIMYCSDPSSVAKHILPDPVKPDDLRSWVGTLADNGVDLLVQDVYNQGYTVYWQSERFQYDQREQHRRFLPMLDAGIQPLQVLLDLSHERNMAFLAGFRMNDTHDFPVYADFIKSHPEWHLKDWPREVRGYQSGRPLDFTFDEVRDFTFEVMKEVVSRFDVDGLDMTFRNPGYFPFPHGRERAHLMTRLMRRLRALLDDLSPSRGKRILLGARVFSTLEECLDMGLDVPTWIAEGLIGYVSPEDVHYSDFNAPYAEFGDLTRDSHCLMYPALHPFISIRKRRLQKSSMTPANYRALARTFYAAGADGICFFNHFDPKVFSVFQELRNPGKVIHNERHYVFDPTWEWLAKPPPFGLDRTITGAVKVQRVLLDRNATNPSGVYLFRLYEQIGRVGGVTLRLSGNLTQNDKLEIQLNGVPLSAGRKPDQWPDSPPGSSVDPQTIRWLPVPSTAMAYGKNRLNITLTRSDPQVTGQLVIDEVQVWVQPS